MKEELKEIKDERLRRIADIMVAFSDKYRTIFSSNKNLGVPYELLSSDIYMIHEWIQNRNRITVSVNSFVIDQEVNKRFIASYKNNQPPVKIDVMKLDFLGYGGRIIHEWYYRDNEWKKNSPNLILVK
ncbi:MAG TPA: hypothetical protein VI583_09990 [Cyclobacteriaceae bacterium]|nr:hypothetical protein [Cyclobacteriaceae bacterium]